MCLNIQRIKNVLVAGGLSTTCFATPILAENSDPAVKVSGLLETEVMLSNSKTAADSKKSSDTVLATVELHFDAKLSDMVSGHVMLLHEEDETPFGLDEATITIGKEAGLSFTMGQMYLPFGVFDTNMVSDPMTLEMGEIRESAMMLTYSAGEYSSSVYLFNGNVHKGDTTKLEHKGISLKYEHDAINVGFDYLSSMVESEALQALMVDPNVTPEAYLPIDKYIAGTAFHAIYRGDTFSIIVERVAAMDKFAASDGETAPNANDGALANKKPVTTNVEFGYDINGNTIGLALQGSKDAEGIFPKKKILLALSRTIFDKVGLGVELAKTTDYNEDNTDTTIVGHFAIEF